MSAAPPSRPSAPSGNPLLRVAWKVFAALAVLVGGVLVAGVLLPGSWSAEAERVVAAQPGTILPLLETPRRWDEWTPWPQVSFTYEGPESGVGARRSWDDPDVGRGSFTITEVERPGRVRYRVEVGGGDFEILGTFELASAGSQTRVTWREQGDFGGNPMLAWTALAMRRNHGAALEARLAELAASVESGRTP